MDNIESAKEKILLNGLNFRNESVKANEQQQDKKVEDKTRNSIAEEDKELKNVQKLNEDEAVNSQIEPVVETKVDDNTFAVSQEKPAEIKPIEEKNVKINKDKIKTKKREPKKKVDKGFKNTYIYGFIFIIFSLILEVSSFIRMGLGFLPTNFAIELAIIIILAGIIFIVPTEPAKIVVLSIFFGAQLIMNIANATLFKVMHELVTVDMIFTLDFEAANGFEMNQLDIPTLIISGVVLALFILAIIFGSKYMPKYKIQKSKMAITSLLILLFSVEMIGFGTFTVAKEAYFNAKSEYIMDNNEYLFKTPAVSKYASLKRYGFWGFYINNASNFVGYNGTAPEKELKAIDEFIADGQVANNNSTYLGTNVSGALSGDNLIVIMLESIEWFAIDPYNTENLYNFINNKAIKFENYYSNNKTNISEEIAILGNVPGNYSLKTINKNVGINVPNSLPNLFKQQGYESVNFYHDFLGKFYDRENINNQLGFNEIVALKDGDEGAEFGDFMDDGKFLEETVGVDKFMPSNKSFFSFFTTVTTHGPYGTENKKFSDYYDDFDRNYDDYCNWSRSHNPSWNVPKKGTQEYKILREYKSRAIAVEKMFNVIYNRLVNTTGKDGKPLYDNTTIVMFADHNAYYSDLSYSIKNVEKFSYNKEQYNVPFVIFNKDLQSSTVDTFCNTYDIYPTICDLYGLEYNKSLAQGHSVFSADIEKSVFVSLISGAFDNNFYSVDFQKYVSQTNNVQGNSKLDSFKQNLHNFLTKQEKIERYYEINYESNYANL